MGIGKSHFGRTAVLSAVEQEVGRTEFKRQTSEYLVFEKSVMNAHEVSGMTQGVNSMGFLSSTSRGVMV